MTASLLHEQQRLFTIRIADPRQHLKFAICIACDAAQRRSDLYPAVTARIRDRNTVNIFYNISAAVDMDLLGRGAQYGARLRRCKGYGDRLRTAGRWTQLIGKDAKIRLIGFCLQRSLLSRRDTPVLLWDH